MTRLRVSYCLVKLALFVLLAASAAMDAAQAQRRQRVEEPPLLAILPSIADETARCSAAFYQELAPVRDANARQLAGFEQAARVVEPGMTGKWLFWNKAGKAAAPERVCAESSTKAGRERCVRWEIKPVDPIRVTSPAPPPPNPNELMVLKALDGFVTDKGAPLEFGTNGRQFATLQRFAAEFGSYIEQPRHPALCTGVPQMLDFHTANLAGVAKRLIDVTANARRAEQMALAGVNALVPLRAALATAAAAATASDPTTPSASAGQPVAAPLPQGTSTSAMVRAALAGLIAEEALQSLKSETSGPSLLLKARDLLATSLLPDAHPALRAAAGASLRMIEAAAYAALQVDRVKQFEGILLGPLAKVRDAHRATCTCGS